MRKILSTLAVLAAFYLSSFSVANAANPDRLRCDPDGGGPISGDEGIYTAIGCIPVLTKDVNNFLSWILTWAIGIAGGIAFLLILLAGFQIITSQGNPEKMKAGQELLTAAIMGLLLLIFSVFILNFIGVDVLGIPL